MTEYLTSFHLSCLKIYKVVGYIVVACRWSLNEYLCVERFIGFTLMPQERGHSSDSSGHGLDGEHNLRGITFL